MSATARKGKGETDNIPAWEWAVAAIGLTLLLALIGYLTYRAVTGGDSPPDVSLRADSVVTTRQGFLVMFTAENSGRATAAALEIEGSVMSGDRVVEASTASIEYLAPGSEHSGGLFFTEDPRLHRLELRARGYQNP